MMILFPASFTSLSQTDTRDPSPSSYPQLFFVFSQIFHNQSPLFSSHSSHIFLPYSDPYVSKL